MTALKPLETLKVKGMVAGVYEANKVCAHPECSDPVGDKGHHIFPRSLIGNGMYFVQAWDADDKEMFEHPIPHVTGLCRKHHDAVEWHEAWIKLEGGVFVWYDRPEPTEEEFVAWQEETGKTYAQRGDYLADVERWVRVGPLDPQPAGKEKVHKPKRKRLAGEERAARKTVSVRLPDGVEGGYWDELLADATETELDQGDTKFDPNIKEIPVGKLLVAVLERFTGRA